MKHDSHHLLIVVQHRWQHIFDSSLHKNSSNHSETFPITVNFFQCFNYQPSDHKPTDCMSTDTCQSQKLETLITFLGVVII